MITAIAAMDMSGLIGIDDELPWLPVKQRADMWRLRRLTYGHPIIMGWNTYVGLSNVGKSKRRIVVLSGDPKHREMFIEARNDLHRVAASVPEALGFALEMRKETYSDRTIIFGGASVYEQTIDLWDRLELTIVQHRFDYDRNYVLPAYMPTPVLSAVKRHTEGLTGRSAFWVSAVRFQQADDHNKYPMAFVTLNAERHRQEVMDYVTM